MLTDERRDAATAAAAVEHLRNNWSSVNCIEARSRHRVRPTMASIVNAGFQPQRRPSSMKSRHWQQRKKPNTRRWPLAASAADFTCACRRARRRTGATSRRMHRRHRADSDVERAVCRPDHYTASQYRPRSKHNAILSDTEGRRPDGSCRSKQAIDWPLRKKVARRYSSPGVLHTQTHTQTHRRTHTHTHAHTHTLTYTHTDTHAQTRAVAATVSRARTPVVFSRIFHLCPAAQVSGDATDRRLSTTHARWTQPAPTSASFSSQKRRRLVPLLRHRRPFETA